jgi:hypothetical protein
VLSSSVSCSERSRCDSEALRHASSLSLSRSRSLPRPPAVTVSQLGLDHSLQPRMREAVREHLGPILGQKVQRFAQAFSRHWSTGFAHSQVGNTC